jgi:AcrR family transcriptional regulator
MRIQKAEIRRRIIDAAYGCFWRSGFRRTSVDKIAEQAGVTKRTIYSYFRSKDDLLATVLLRYGELAAERLQHIGERMPADRPLLGAKRTFANLPSSVEGRKADWSFDDCNAHCVDVCQ